MKKIERFIDSIFNSLAIEVLICVLSIFIGTQFSVLLVDSIYDIKPALEMDYLELEEKMQKVSQDPKILLDNNFEYSYVNNENGNKTITFENSECKLIAIYDANYKIVSNKKEDKYTGLPTIIITWGVLYIIFTFTTLFIETFLVYLILPNILIFISRQIRISHCS